MRVASNFERFSLDIDRPSQRQIVHTVRRRYAAARYARHPRRVASLRTRGPASPAGTGSVSPHVGSPDRQLRKSNDLKCLKYRLEEPIGRKNSAPKSYTYHKAMQHFPITQGSAHLPEARATPWCCHHPRPAPSPPASQSVLRADRARSPCHGFVGVGEPITP